MTHEEIMDAVREYTTKGIERAKQNAAQDAVKYSGVNDWTSYVGTGLFQNYLLAALIERLDASR